MSLHESRREAKIIELALQIARAKRLGAYLTTNGPDEVWAFVDQDRAESMVEMWHRQIEREAEIILLELSTKNTVRVNDEQRGDADNDSIGGGGNTPAG